MPFSRGEMPAVDAWSSQPYCGVPVEIRVPAHLESLSIIRKLVIAIGTHEDLDLDDTVADLTLAVDEASTALIQAAAPESALFVTIEPHEDDVRVSVSAQCDGNDALAPWTFSWHVISSLTDDVTTFHGRATGDEPGGLFGVTMTMRRPMRHLAAQVYTSL